MKKARAPTVVEVDIDKEAEMDIPPPSPIAPASFHSPPPALSTTAGTSFAPPDWYHDLSQHIDMLNLNSRALSEEQDRRFGVIDHRFGELDHRFGVLESQQAEILRILRSQFPLPS